MVPGDDAAEDAVGEIIASFRISGRWTELGFAGIGIR